MLDLRGSRSKFNLIFYEVELVTQKKNFQKNFPQSVTSFCVTRFRNSRIPNLIMH